MPPISPKVFVLGLADLAVSRDPISILATYSLGSCLGVAVYDPVARVGGLLHAMLPDSSLDPAKAAAQPGMFVNSGMDALLSAMVKNGGQEPRLQVYVAGGAQIMDDRGFFNIGARNCAALTQYLSERQLRVQGQQVGGYVNRTLRLFIATGRVSLKVSGQPGEVFL